MQDDIINIIKDISDKVNALYIEKESQNTHHEQTMELQDPNYDDPHSRIRAPLVEVEGYTELLRAISSMGEDFFRIPLKDEGRKEAIYSFHKFMPMNYQPPPLNEAASTTAKKMDSTLVGYQILLAQITRPLDQFKEKRAKIFIKGARTRAARIQDTVQEIRISPTYGTSSPPQEKDEKRCSQYYYKRGKLTFSKESDRASKKPINWVLQSYIHYSQKNRGSPACFRLKNAEKVCGRTLVQNGNDEDNMSHVAQKRIYDVDRLRRCFPAYSHSRELQKIPEVSMEWENIPVQSSPIRFISNPPNIYKNTQPGYYVVQVTRHKNSSIFGRHIDSRRIKIGMRGKHQNLVKEAYRSWVQDQRLKILDSFCSNNETFRDDHRYKIDEIEGAQGKDQGPSKEGSEANKGSKLFIKEYGKLHWQSTINVDSHLYWKIDVKKTSGTEEQGFIESQLMYIVNEARRSIHTQPYLLARTPF
ncbi:hypothetical protein AYI68_g4475 [Smittium mucronatum]|uniref:Uncharacterized protein n=1 Tax=Smittium mucronatum TaxID=133383 RepID=A0A1R0GX05_9FUNG|nr:hypothetical protein AYI68_g4475 [Smittium mucronatum]